MSDLQPDREPTEPQPITNPPVSTVSPPARNSRRNLILVVGAIFLSACVCITICGALVGTGVFTVITESPKAEAVIDNYMQAMANKDAVGAYSLFSARTQRQTSITDLEALLEGNNYILFSDYQKVSITNINIQLAANTNPDLPQGTVARVEGVVEYTNDITGTFTAVLEKDGDDWRLFGINVTVPPDKFDSTPR